MKGLGVGKVTREILKERIVMRTYIPCVILFQSKDIGASMKWI